MSTTAPGVTNEIERLRSVVVHRPGEEVARMTQHQLDHLLFDDILSPAAAIEEHD
ncbi:MAG TPA: arginine deiminase, partial [Polyangiaceae bacterium]|nr:arginine deiminase [Polyangiaceae bacterium]